MGISNYRQGESSYRQWESSHRQGEPSSGSKVMDRRVKFRIAGVKLRTVVSQVKDEGNSSYRQEDSCVGI
jgi:hypothetical protein